MGSLHHSGPQFLLRNQRPSKWRGLGSWEERDLKQMGVGKSQAGSLEVITAIHLPLQGRRVLVSDPGTGRGRIFLLFSNHSQEREKGVLERLGWGPL